MNYITIIPVIGTRITGIMKFCIELDIRDAETGIVFSTGIGNGFCGKNFRKTRLTRGKSGLY